MRIGVALSGGVDSAVAAALLKEQGHEVVGVHLLLSELVPPPPNLWGVAELLAIPLYFLDFREEFSRLVVEDFVSQYFLGRTPNPCIRCNALIKFGLLWERLQGMGISHLGTGHYVRLVSREDGGLRLCRGLDPRKDQSYFLCRISRELLPRLVFPLGDLTKEQVQDLAQRLGLAPLTRLTESQDLCFIPTGTCQEFLRLHRPSPGVPGEIVNRAGQVLGRHRGVENYTIGQRRGLGIAARQPLYVIDILPELNRIVVGPREELFSRGLAAREMNWLREPPGREFRATAFIRYRHPGVLSTVRLRNRDHLEVHFDTPQAAVTPGQAVVLYDGDCLWGGAWIEGRLESPRG